MSLTEEVKKLESELDSNLKYVIIGAELKKDSSIRHEGLFIGVHPIVDKITPIASPQDKYFYMYYDGAIKMLNMDYYTINLFEVSIESMTHIKGYTESKEDQEMVMAKLTRAYEAAAKRGWVKNGLIDPDKYTDPGSDTKKRMAKVNGSVPAASKSTAANYSAASKRPARSVTTLGSNKKEVHTSEIKRTTRYAIPTALECMKVKIKAIQDGTYKPPVLKKIPADVVEEKRKEEIAKAEAKKNPMGHPHLCQCPKCSNNNEEQQEYDETWMCC